MAKKRNRSAQDATLQPYGLGATFEANGAAWIVHWIVRLESGVMNAHAARVPDGGDVYGMGREWDAEAQPQRIIAWHEDQARA